MEDQEEQTQSWHQLDWGSDARLVKRENENPEQRMRRLKGSFPDYDATLDPFTPHYKPSKNHGPQATDMRGERLRCERWLAVHGKDQMIFTGTMCMSWVWPWWWGKPQVRYQWDPYCESPIIINGQPARELRFPSGVTLWQLLTPVHGYDEAGATLFDPEDHHMLKELQTRENNTE